MALSLFNDDFYLFDPFRTMKRMQRDMDSLFSSLGETGTSQMTSWAPRCDVKEADNSIIVQAELPGVKKEDIQLDLQDGILTISGETSDEKKEENEKFRRIERSHGSFMRRLAVPEGVTEKDIKATYDNGVLHVEFPKAVKQLPEKKTIAITGGSE